jgi:hypothetical protein
VSEVSQAFKVNEVCPALMASEVSKARTSSDDPVLKALKVGTATAASRVLEALMVRTVKPVDQVKTLPIGRVQLV